jgi:ubiquinone/menaquinone biosynthesis C-methylase UbiE
MHKPDYTLKKTQPLLTDGYYDPVFGRSLFDSVSKSYDLVNNVANFRMPVLIRKKIIGGLASDNRELKILDLMSGRGENWREISRVYPRGKIIAVDISEKMSELSAAVINRYSGSHITVLNTDIFETDFETGYFDIVICSFGIKCLSVAQLEVLTVMLKKIIKKDGKFLFIEVSRPHNKFTGRILSAHLKHTVPFIAGIFHRRRTAYKMLWEYFDRFSIDEAVSIFKKHDLRVKTRTHFYGSVISIRN